MLNLGKKKSDSRLSLADFQVNEKPVVDSKSELKGGQTTGGGVSFWDAVGWLFYSDSQDNDCH